MEWLKYAVDATHVIDGDSFVTLFSEAAAQNDTFRTTLSVTIVSDESCLGTCQQVAVSIVES